MSISWSSARGEAGRRLATGALLALFLLLHLHDYYAQERSRLSTILMAGGFLLFMAGILAAAARRPGETAAAPLSRARRWVPRIAAGLVCAACGAMHALAARHAPLPLLLFSCGAAAVVLFVVCCEDPASTASSCAAACIFTLLLLSPQPYQGMVLFHERTLAFQAAAWTTLSLFFACALLAPPARVLFLLAAACGAALRVLCIRQWPLNGFVRDMLPLIQSAISSLLSGENPYRMHFLSHDVPLTYLPLLWLSYLPAYLARIDIRWTNVLLAVATAFLVMRWGMFKRPQGIVNPPARGAGTPPQGGERLPASGSDLSERPQGIVNPPARCAGTPPQGGTLSSRVRSLVTQEVSPLFLMASLVFLFHPEVFWNSVHAEPPVYWFFLALFFSFVRAGRPAAASAALGLLLGARHFSILLVPFHLAWLRRSGLSWKETAAQLMGAGALGLALVLPWLLPNPGPFLYGTLEWLAGYGAANRPAWAFQLGAQSWFYAAGRESLLAVIQPAVFSALFLATVAAIAAAARGRLGGLSEAPPRLLAWGGFAAAYLAFVCTGGMIWKSFLVSPFLAALAAAVLPAAAASPGGPGPGAAPRGILPRRPAAALLVLIMLLAASAGGGALVLRSARQWKDRGDVASLAAEAAPLLRQGDLVQDYGLLNAWHVYQGSAFTGIPVAPGVVISQAPRSQENMVFRRIVLFDGYSLLSPARDYPDIAGAYRLALARTKGRSRLSIYERPGPFTEKWRASADFDATAGVRFTSPSAPSIEGQRHGSVYLFGGLDPWIWTGTYPCQVAGVARPSIFAQLVEGKWLAVEVAPPAAGRLWLVTAVDDRALSMPFAPLVVAAGGSVRSAVVRHPPRKGIFSWPLGETDGGKATVSFQGAPGAPPNVCFDLVLSE